MEDEINILAVSVLDGVDHAVVRLIVSDSNRAIHLLEERGILVCENEVLLLEATNSPGMLLEVSRRLAKAKINVEYLYCAVRPRQRKGAVVLRPSNLNKAMKVLSDIC